MSKQAVANVNTPEKVTWLYMGIIVLAQMQMAFNVNAIPVSIGPIVEELNVPSTGVGTALVVYSLFVAAFVMVGAKLGKIFGDRLVFQITVLLHGLAMAVMAISQNASMMNAAQAMAGLAAAALVPTLVVLIAANYSGPQKSQALGILAATPALSGALAFFVAGFLGTYLSWRYSFGLLTFVSIVVFLLSFRLHPVPRQSGVKIDAIGVALSAIAVILISFGFNNLNNWGIVLASSNAPFNLVGLSPAMLFVVFGLLLFQAFFAWSHQRAELGRMPLLSLEVLDSPTERATIICLLVIGALGPAVNFLIPLFIQIVQGRTTMQTAIAVVPYTLSIAASAIFIVRFYDRFTPRRIAIVAFALVAAGLTLLSFVVGNNWGTAMVILGLLLVGLGEGSLLTLLFNVMVTSAPKSLAGDVGALRGVANNLSTALGTAFAGVVAVGLLSLFISSAIAQANPPRALLRQVNLDNVNFISNDQLDDFLAQTTATPEQVAMAVNINEMARLRALRASFLILGAFALLAIFPALGLPDYAPGDEPPPPPVEVTKPKPRSRKKAPAK
ncbi:putative major facilitator superfamily transporter [Candidatus Promineifilum breve]|uniref:Major facilitator superfamily transporter n=1 Tax=Candidatus Promineifilum breve TaxID=1806508 RepID=A0A160T6G0_9CHLR|nr:MFS transporter [Candidatus Promineifilum breve]CUS05129.2 putative major facilitator superfamily transporter [Candidatus Promineifilum breve]